MTSFNDDLVWKALADPLRREILDLLAAAPMTTGELVEHLSHLCRTAVMKHLDVLTAADLVTVRREGRFRWNSLNPVPIERVCQRWVNGHVRKLASSLNRLKNVVETAELPVTSNSDTQRSAEQSRRRTVRNSRTS
ncbi:MAG: helix-turn-helix transcriptional regulator [Fuerstia sp.]|nr:helix-turn-helix transcriptional regulator [Fuerstiella sp.]